MPKITELLAQGCTLSFEFSAPREPEGERRLSRTLDRLAELRPAFMSVTYGAGGTSRGPTPEVVRQIIGLGVTGMPHLTCVSHTREEIRGLLDAYAEMGVENLLALHGDLPEGTSEVPAGHFTRAVDLVALARLRTDWSIGVAAHPEGHPKAASPAADLDHHAEKLHAADFAITQFFFRVEYYERFIEAMAARGIRTPVIAGIMPPTNVEGIGRMAALNGTEYPREITERLAAVGEDVDARRLIAIEEATRLGEALLKAGAPGLHIYTMNFSEPARTVARNLGLAPD